MADRPIDLTEGWTDPLPFQLTIDGVGMNLAGFTVTGILTHRQGTVDVSGDVAVTVEGEGKVTYTPDSTDLTAANSPYRLRFKVQDGAGAVVYFPPGVAQELRVHRP